jgi:hypothetical protein
MCGQPPQTWVDHLAKYPDQAPSPGEQKAIACMYANGTICRQSMEWLLGLIDIQEDPRLMSNAERRKHFAIIAAEHRMSDPFKIKRKVNRKRIV